MMTPEEVDGAMLGLAGLVGGSFVRLYVYMCNIVLVHVCDIFVYSYVYNDVTGSAERHYDKALAYLFRSSSVRLHTYACV